MVMLSLITRKHVSCNWIQSIRSSRNLHIVSKNSSLRCQITKQSALLTSACRQYSGSGWTATLCSSSPVLALQDLLVQTHDVTGLPWWMVILTTTVGIRTIATLPFAVHQYQIMARLENIRKELSELAFQLNKEASTAARTYNWDLKTTKRVFKQNMRNYQKRYIIRDNCHPFKSIVLILFQVPLWICLSASLRNLTYMMPVQDANAQMWFHELKSEGVLWFSDLTVPDPFVIPITLCLVNIFLIEMHALRSKAAPSMLMKVVQNMARVTTLIITVVATISPSCLSFYWLCSSSFGCIQAILFMFPKVRRTFRIPMTKSEVATPFKNIYTNFRSKWK